MCQCTKRTSCNWKLWFWYQIVGFRARKVKFRNWYWDLWSSKWIKLHKKTLNNSWSQLGNIPKHKRVYVDFVSYNPPIFWFRSPPADFAWSLQFFGVLTESPACLWGLLYNFCGCQSGLRRHFWFLKIWKSSESVDDVESWSLLLQGCAPWRPELLDARATIFMVCNHGLTRIAIGHHIVVS